MKYDQFVISGQYYKEFARTLQIWAARVPVGAPEKANIFQRAHVGFSAQCLEMLGEDREELTENELTAVMEILDSRGEGEKDDAFWAGL